jgi:hypothetical protein
MLYISEHPLSLYAAAAALCKVTLKSLYIKPAQRQTKVIVVKKPQDIP